MDVGDVERLISAIDKLSSTAERLERNRLQAGNSVGNIHLNAGGVGVWVSVSCVFILVVVNIMQLGSTSNEIRDLKVQYTRMQDYLNAIYAQAPQLKPKEEK